VRFTDLSFNRDAIQSDKIKYLYDSENIKEIMCSPDFGSNRLVHNGVFIKSVDVIYPLFSGNDIGCGFHFSAFNTDIEKVNNIIDNINDFIEISDGNYSGSNKAFSKFPWLSTLIRKYGTDILYCLEEGNHFIELRNINKLYDINTCNRLDVNENTFLLMIHSGNANSILNRIRQLQVKAIEGVKNKKTDNGYIPILELDSIQGKEFLRIVGNAMKIAEIGRRVMTKMILRNTIVNFEVDSMHDYITYANGYIQHHKSIQKFNPVKSRSIALMPGDKYDLAFIVLEGSLGDKMNHGLPYKRNGLGYIKSLETINYCKEIDLCSPIASFSPFITIKKVNGKLKMVNLI
jgi:hypothetical protein